MPRAKRNGSSTTTIEQQYSAAGLAKAHWVRDFIETHCTYSQGEWAGKPFRLLPWQWERVVLPLYGTLRADGRRQYRYCYIEIPKKNGKTELCAALGLYMLMADHEKGPRVYIAASDREQAGLTYKAAATMVRANHALASRLRCRDSLKRIAYPAKNGELQVLSSEAYTKHGLNPSCVIVDEIHAHPNDELWNVLTSQTDTARTQQVVLVITTAGVYDKNSIWWKLRTKAQQIEAGLIADPSFLPVLYIADPEQDDAHDEELWKRVNPSLGHIFTLDKIRQDYEAAKHDLVDFLNFKRFRLNIPINSVSQWMPVEEWEACADRSLRFEDFKGMPCFLGFDLANKIDISALIIAFPVGDGVVVFGRYYLPEETISATKTPHYFRWWQEGRIIKTPGAMTDYKFIEDDIRAIHKTNPIREIDFDQREASYLIANIQEWLGEDRCVEVTQSVGQLNEPMKELEGLIRSRKIRHDGDPILAWMMGNVVLKTARDSGPIKSYFPTRTTDENKIDGAVALIMAIKGLKSGRWAPSVYASRGLLIL